MDPGDIDQQLTALPGWVTRSAAASGAAHHRDLVCGVNHAMLQALTDHLGGHPPVRAVPDPQPGRCCVVLTREGSAADRVPAPNVAPDEVASPG